MSTTKEDLPVTSTEVVSKEKPAASAAGEEGKGTVKAPKSKGPVGDPVKLFNSWCKGCGICVAFCPTKTLGISPITGKCVIVLPEACTKCGLCELRCPDFAITVVLDERPERGDKNA